MPRRLGPARTGFAPARVGLRRPPGGTLARRWHGCHDQVAAAVAASKQPSHPTAPLSSYPLLVAMLRSCQVLLVYPCLSWSQPSSPRSVEPQETASGARARPKSGSAGLGREPVGRLAAMGDVG